MRFHRAAWVRLALKCTTPSWSRPHTWPRLPSSTCLSCGVSLSSGLRFTSHSLPVWLLADTPLRTSRRPLRVTATTPLSDADTDTSGGGVCCDGEDESLVETGEDTLLHEVSLLLSAPGLAAGLKNSAPCWLMPHRLPGAAP